MKSDIILAGVGGQGILSIASVIGMAALENHLLKTGRGSWNESTRRCSSVTSKNFRERNRK